jgi:Chaperone of endosialidase
MGYANPQSQLQGGGWNYMNPTQAPDTQGAYNGYQAQNAQTAQIDQSGAQPYNQAEQGLMGQLQQQAQGQGPNIAQQQLQAATAQNIQQQQAAAASQQGNQNPGLAAQQLAQNAAMTQQGAAGQSAMLRSQQQLAAQQALAGVAQTGAAQQLGVAGQNAGYAQQAGLANAGAQNQAGQFNSQALQNQAQQAYQQWLAQNQFSQTANNQYNSYVGGIEQGNSASQAGMTNSLAQSGVGLGTTLLGGLLSDERAKVDIAPGDDAVRALLAGLSAKTYRYKDPSLAGAAPGNRLGILAQDLERTPHGKALVSEIDGVKRIDATQAVGVLLAGLAAQQKDIDALKKGKG